MRSVLIILLSVPMCAIALMDDVAFIGSLTSTATIQSVNPTNIAGYPAISWWKGDDWVTNSSGESWPDRGTNHYTLTQVEKTANITNGIIDSQSFVHFSGNDYSYMSSSSYTSSQPHTLVLLVRILQPSSIGSASMLIGNSANQYFYIRGSNGELGLDGGSFDTVGAPLWTSNSWVVIEGVWNGASSAIYTNGILADTGNAGTATASIMKLLASSNFTGSTVADILEAATYNTNFNASARSSLYNYFKTNYPSASLP